MVATTRSSHAIHVDVKSTGRSAVSACRPETTSPIEIRSSGRSRPSPIAWTTSPASRVAVATSSTTTWERPVSIPSTSRASGSCDPTATSTASSRTVAPSNRGLRAVVAHTTTSACETASCACVPVEGSSIMGT
jgi:hypothetical protein